MVREILLMNLERKFTIKSTLTIRDRSGMINYERIQEKIGLYNILGG